MKGNRGPAEPGSQRGERRRRSGRTWASGGGKSQLSHLQNVRSTQHRGGRNPAQGNLGSAPGIYDSTCVPMFAYTWPPSCAAVMEWARSRSCEPCLRWAAWVNSPVPVSPCPPPDSAGGRPLAPLAHSSKSTPLPTAMGTLHAKTPEHMPSSLRPSLRT